MKKFLLAIFPLLLFFSCLFDFKSKKVSGNYYLVAVDNGEYKLSYRLSQGDFIERVEGPISGYQNITDSFLVVLQSTKTKNYFIIDMIRDNGYSELAHILRGPYDESSIKEIYVEEFKNAPFQIKELP